MFFFKNIYLNQEMISELFPVYLNRYKILLLVLHAHNNNQPPFSLALIQHLDAKYWSNSSAFTTINDHNSDHNFHDKKLFRIHSCSVATIPTACAPCSPSSNNASKITSPLHVESGSMYWKDKIRVFKTHISNIIYFLKIIILYDL